MRRDVLQEVDLGWCLAGLGLAEEGSLFFVKLFKPLCRQGILHIINYSMYGMHSIYVERLLGLCKLQVVYRRGKPPCMYKYISREAPTSLIRTYLLTWHMVPSN